MMELQGGKSSPISAVGQALLATDLVAFALLDWHGTIVASNDAFVGMVARDRCELDGSQIAFSDFVAPEHRALAESALSEARRLGRCQPFEAELVRCTGKRMPVLIGYTHVAVEREDAAFVIDQSARRRAEATSRESQRQLATLLANLPGMAYRVKADGSWKPELVSDGIHALTGHPAADFVAGRISFRDLVHPEDLARITDEIAYAVERRRQFEVVHRIMHADGRTLWVHSCGQGVYERDGLPIAIEGFVSDVTRLKQAEEELRATDRKKDEFLATLAHELRNPLAPLRSGIELLRVAELDADKRSEVVEMCERQVLALARLVGDLLEFARMTHGLMELKKELVDLADVIERAVETSRALIESRRHRLTVSVPREKLMVDGDVVRLTQVVGNLLNNAAKYTPHGGEITVTLSRDDGSAVLCVKDNGIGIPAHDLERVFDVFAQVDASNSRAQGGLGVGLSLVRRIVELHQGVVYALSEGLGAGSTFVLRFPLRAVSTTAAHQYTPVPVPRRRIVVIDDNRDAADTVRLLLELMGNQVWVAYDGRSGIELCRQHRPDAVLLDLGMPELSGLEVAQRLREDPELADLRLIAVTGFGQQEDVRACEAAGFDTHLLKPVSLAELQAALAAKSPRRR